MPDYLAAIILTAVILLLAAGLMCLPIDPELPGDDTLQELPPKQAHVVMQNHLRCSITSCAHKRAAYRALTAAGAITPDQRAERYLHEQRR